MFFFLLFFTSTDTKGHHLKTKEYRMDELRKHEALISEYHKALEKSFVEVKHALKLYMKTTDKNDTNEQLAQKVGQIKKDTDQFKDSLVDMSGKLAEFRLQLPTDVQTRSTPGRRGAEHADGTDSGYVASTNSSIITQPEENLENPTQGSRNLIAQPQDSVEGQELESDA